MKHLLRTSGVAVLLALSAVGSLPASQNHQKPVRTLSIRGTVIPAENEPDALYASADAVLLVRVESSKSFLQQLGPRAGNAESVRTEHLVKVIEVLKGNSTLRQDKDVLVEQSRGEVDAGEYIVKTAEPAISKGE